MSALLNNSFDYSIVRVMPRVERAEFVNVGVIVFCRSLRYLAAQIELEPNRLAALDPKLDLEFIQAHLATIPLICKGGSQAGHIGSLTQAERFYWLVAPRSTIIQFAPVHAGLCHEPSLALEQLLQTMVRL